MVYNILEQHCTHKAGQRAVPSSLLLWTFLLLVTCPSLPHTQVIITVQPASAFIGQQWEGQITRIE
jgi:hypothetical protein